MAWFTVLLLCSIVTAMKSTSLYMKRSGLADLKTSASGYIYQQSAASGPVSYVQFNPGPQEYRALKPLPLLLTEQASATKQNLEIVEDYPENEEYTKAMGEDNNSGYAQQNGAKSVAEYDKKHAYDKGDKGSFEKEQHQNHYLQNGGGKDGHYNSQDGYQSNHDEGKATKGENFSVSGYHKKGQKTTGYHKVYHKDEYKKDHTFYDESDKKGHFSKFANSQNNHKAEAGGHKNGGSHNSAFRNNLYGKQGFLENGRSEQAEKGHDSASGRDIYENVQAKFGQNNDQQNSKQFGFSAKQ